ncbi:PREDICTED: transmembrane protein 35B [Gavialis gangeticus]|uniref:transmembrane protein 35B n=1 Tax=Gavialis gangeticus TaxID=94835 RepID=UPI00092EDBD4|nr:PREDICTED: transmembrane protein 35B [Gavialis gangeticus]
MALLFAAVRVVLGLFFLFVGAAKLTEQISAELYLRMKSQFVQFADVFPLKEFGYKPEPVRYLEVVGWIEVVAGLSLAFGPQLLQEISNFVLTIIMIGSIYTLLVLKESIAMCAPATVCLGLLLLLNIRGREGRAKPKFE